MTGEPTPQEKQLARELTEATRQENTLALERSGQRAYPHATQAERNPEGR